MNTPSGLGFNRGFLVNRVTNNIKNSTEHFFTNRNSDGGTGIYCIHSTDQTIGRMHRHRANRVITKVQCHFANQGFNFSTFSSTLNIDCVIQGWKNTVFKVHIYDGTHNLDDLSLIHSFPPQFSVSFTPSTLQGFSAIYDFYQFFGDIRLSGFIIGQC